MAGWLGVSLRETTPALAWSGKPFTDVPLPASIEQYDADEAAFAATAAAISPGIAVYKFGRTGTPGISDIDILCVVPDDLATTALDRLASIPRSRLFAHGAILLPRSAWNDFLYLMPVVEPWWLDGADHRPDLNRLSPGKMRDLSLIECFEGAVHKWKGFQLAGRAPTLPVRRLMLALWSVRHSIAYANLAGLAIDPNWQRFSDDCVALRCAWTQHGSVDLQRMSALLGDAPAILEQLATAASIECLLRANETPDEPVGGGGGRTLLNISDGTTWRYRQWIARMASRTRHYHELSIPRNILALRNHRWAPDSDFGMAATRRKTASMQRIALNKRVRRPGASGEPSLFEDASPTPLMRWMDALALRSMARRRPHPLTWR